MAQTNNKRLYILLSILGILTIYLILSRTVFNKKDRPRPTSANVVTSAYEDTPTERQSNTSKPRKRTDYSKAVIEEFQFDGNWRRDPFYYLSADSLQSLREKELGRYTELKLTGISLLRDEGYSLINSTIMTDTDTVMTASILKEGDEFDGFRVIKIAFDHVILRSGNRNIRLEIDEY